MIVKFHQRGQKKLQSFEYFPGQSYYYSSKFQAFCRGSLYPSDNFLNILIGTKKIKIALANKNFNFNWYIVDNHMIIEYCQYRISIGLN